MNRRVLGPTAAGCFAAVLTVLLSNASPVSAQETATLEPEVGRAFEFPLTIRSIMRGSELVGQSPQQVRWTDDSRWVYFRWLPGGEPWHKSRDLYRVAADGGQPEKLDDDAVDSVAVLIASGDLSPDRSLRVSSVDGDLYVVNRADMSVRRLSETVESEGAARFSADGTEVFFRRGSNLYAVALDGSAIRQLTDIRTGPKPTEDGEAEGQEGFLEAQQLELFEHIRIAREREEQQEELRERQDERRPEPLYLDREELAGSLVPAPTGHYVAVMASRRDGAEQTMVPNWITETGYTEELNSRAKVGGEQGRSRIGILEVESGAITWLDVASDRGRKAEESADADTTSAANETSAEGAGQDSTSSRRPAGLAMLRFVGWNDSGTHGLIFAVDQDFKEWRLYAVEAATGQLTLLDSLADEAWVGGPCFGSCLGWYPDADRIAGSGPRAWYVSEATGYAHLYGVNADGSDREQLTRGEWEVARVTIPESRDGFLLHTREVSPFDLHPYRMEFDGAGRVRMIDGDGRFDATPSPGGGRLAVVHSRSNRPPELFLADNRVGQRRADLDRITVSPTAEWQTFPWIEPEIVRFPAADGAQVPARIYRPGDVGAEPNGAAVIFVHGAGYTQNVHHGWASYYREYMFHHLLAASGYTVLDIDYRASEGYGRDWRTATYRWMGGKDLSDQVDGAAYVVRQEGVDADRIGIYGGSYGGFMTLMALFTEPDVFAAGAALRSVTDWAHYNHWYTSRILNLPQDDEEAYRRSSPIYFAEGFKGHLLMAHGMIDTNVQISDVVRLAQRLIELGKENWELAVYPVERHSFVEPSSWTDEYRRIYELFERTIGTGSGNH
jgi:dipeptidyl aminopeptidase/acylaminoacyl peptidase